MPKPRELEVPNRIHKLNRERLLTQIKVDGAVLLLPGVASLPIDDSDIDYPIQQESNFWYLFGVEEPDCYGLMELDTGKATVFIPRLEEDYKLWMYVPPQEEIRTRWGLDEVRYVDELEDYLKAKQPTAIYLYDGVNTDSKLRPRLPTFPFLTNYTLNKEDLYNALDEARVIKNQEEIKVMRHICKVSSEAHE